MDPNLQFRFAVPGWVGVIAFLSIGWATGASWFTELTEPHSNQALPAALAAILAGPSVGFLLNTVVIAICHLFKKGPEHGKCLLRFSERVKDVCSSERLAEKPRLVEVLSKLQTPVVVAHFEYRTDPEAMLGWRRRQRAAFFADWSAVLAIILGVCLGLSFTVPDWLATSVPSTIVLVRLLTVVFVWLVLVSCLALLAGISEFNAEQQQMIWAESWTDDDIEEFLATYGTGFYEFPKPPPQRQGKR
jgi:hypothetical protein